MIDIYIKKHKVMKAIREYFEKTGSIEVFTPIMNRFPNLDSNIFPVELQVENSCGESIKAYLHTSPEYNMKKILSQIKQDIHQITHVFRNYEGSKLHTVEFMMLEWYRVGKDMYQLMEDTKSIFVESALSIYNKTEILFRGKKYDLSKWEKITLEEAFYRYTGTDLENRDSLYKFLKNSPIKHERISPENYEELFFTVYSFYVEPNLGKDIPTFVYDFPPEFSALSKVIDGKGKRFEAYIGGVELVNGYYELIDREKVKDALEKDKEKKSKSGKDYPVDYEFINSTVNLPECSGASLGIDRLLMVLLNKNEIRETQGLKWI
ncbi:lysyl-tRNA synthetase, class 2 [Persephonella hydrogeniphila]|uniref:Lysyl-tRNA synthetase, class 2 n=1 Tax=Persephonella hydrogeniphila TaxID=198703 RepID=A0A285N1J2_9AQUI|nr:elongation factor P--(R)-beta-lysine ligase [Persephonella hydrogeniphila]SNZ03345.1 lysyl-tRNA synthetase, class 2 [Persephonella hydrogeniphila]